MATGVRRAHPAVPSRRGPRPGTGQVRNVEWLTRLRERRRVDPEELEIAQAISRSRLEELFAVPVSVINLPVPAAVEPDGPIGGDPDAGLWEPAMADPWGGMTPGSARAGPASAPGTERGPLAEPLSPAPILLPSAYAAYGARGYGASGSAGVRPTVLVLCPSCGVALDPPPTHSRRCPECRERIVVRHRAGSVVYLTEEWGAAWDAERWAARSGRGGPVPAANDNGEG